MKNTRGWRDNFEIEDHQFQSFIPLQARHLIVGTFHTHPENLGYRFYYSGKENLFWSVMEKVFQHSFRHSAAEPAAEERKQLLTDKKIGITDMIEKCYRRNRLSTDENLFPIVLRDIFPILQTHSEIDTLIFTSRTEVFGALGLFKTYLLQRGLQLTELKKRPDRILEGELARNGRSYRIWYLIPLRQG